MRYEHNRKGTGEKGSTGRDVGEALTELEPECFVLMRLGKKTFVMQSTSVYQQLAE